MQEIHNTCEECGEESWDNHVWEKCPACKCHNTAYKVYEDGEEES